MPCAGHPRGNEEFCQMTRSPTASQPLAGWHDLQNRRRYLDREFPLVRTESGRIGTSRVRFSRGRLGVPSKLVLVWERKIVQPQENCAILQLAR